MVRAILTNNGDISVHLNPGLFVSLNHLTLTITAVQHQRLKEFKSRALEDGPTLSINQSISWK